MKPWRTTGVAGAVAVALLAGACSGGSRSTGSTGSTGSPAAVPVTGPAAAAARVDVPAGMATAPFDTPRTLQLPTGWRASVWARVPGARVQVWAPDGRLLVSRPGDGNVTALTPQASGAPTQQTLVAGLRQPHGLAFDGSTLYVAESNQVDAYTYADGRLGGRRVVVTDLPDSRSPELHGQYAHALKTLTVGRDGSLYIVVGSTGNISAEDRTASPQRAVVLRWSPATKQTAVFAHGIRNGTAIGVDPDGAVWTAVNNRDRMPYPYARDFDGDGSADAGRVIQGFVDDHPLEPVAKLTAGRDLGWPFCDPDPSVEAGGRGSPLAFADRPFVNDPDTNPTGSALDCAALPRIEQGLPAHSAPLGLSFTTLPAPFGAGALVTSHGSWNRTPPQPPSVVFFPERDGQLGDAMPLVTGFQDADGSRWGRTVTAVRGPDAAIYVSDDSAGAIYRLTTG